MYAYSRTHTRNRRGQDTGGNAASFEFIQIKTPLEYPEAVLPDRAFYLQTFSHLLIVNKLHSHSQAPQLSQAVFTPASALYLPVNLACDNCGRTIGDQIYIKGVTIKAMVELRERNSDVTSYCQ
jgi:hypothetical protein